MKESVKIFLSSFVPMKLITGNYNPILLYHSLGNNSKFEENIDHVSLEILETHLKDIQKYWKFVSTYKEEAEKNKIGIKMDKLNFTVFNFIWRPRRCYYDWVRAKQKYTAS